MDSAHSGMYFSPEMMKYNLTFQRSRVPAARLYSCSPDIASPEVNLIRRLKSLSISSWPCSCSGYTFPESLYLLPERLANGRITTTTSLPVVFHRSIPISHVSCSGKLVQELTTNWSSERTNCPSLLYLRSFAQGLFHRCIKPIFRARRVNYTLCPACDRSVDAPMTQSQDVTVAGQERPSVSADSLQTLYTDDVETQPLLPQSSLDVESKQTTGVVTNN